MSIETVPLPLPSTASPTKFVDFGREVRGVNPGVLSREQFREIEELLFKHSVLLFRDVDVTPEQQYGLVKAFDLSCEHYGHGNNKTGQTKQSILHPYLKTIPRVPQVQLIGHGTVYNHEGIPEAHLKHASHRSFHKTHVSQEDEANGVTRFYRWHMDAALYDLAPPKVTTLYGISVPRGDPQTMFDVLPPELKSVAVRSRVKYAPHPFIWMATAHAKSTGLGIENEGLETALNQLPSWEDSKVQIYPLLWKNPVTGGLHLQAHPCGARELFVDPLPENAKREGSLYPDGTHIVDLGLVRELLYKLQRPGIAPNLVYPHEWRERDMVLFHNRGVLHSVVGHFAEGQTRAFHQCNLAASDEPIGPSPEDVFTWA